jgi:POT family proton-dependent oligopeptide transporter
MSMFLLTTAFGAALGAIISPFAKDPDLFWVYSGLAAVCFGSGWVFWYCFRGMNDVEDGVGMLERET